ncbi:unnamed protein product [Cuscuta epithymum]|uniref:Uncharacterized protein n=1 Tax=Cuscuta epithymum TaxID=186058 RepID=A0AAV0FWF0_9ASTE|nr:unnamed protein product [Cuscuta epithymum]
MAPHGVQRPVETTASFWPMGSLVADGVPADGVLADGVPADGVLADEVPADGGADGGRWYVVRQQASPSRCVTGRWCFLLGRRETTCCCSRMGTHLAEVNRLLNFGWYLRSTSEPGTSRRAAGQGSHQLDEGSCLVFWPP